MYHVVAATTNPAKIQAITLAFDATFGAGQYRIEGIDVDSGVPEQPWAASRRAAGRVTALSAPVNCGQKQTFGSALRRELKII